MEHIEEIKQYFKKLQRILTNEGDFRFLDIKLIKKEKIDDILCCIFAVLPDVYKNEIKCKSEKGKKMLSLTCYYKLFNAIKRKFFLNNNVYLVEFKTAIEAINVILSYIESDINMLEKNKRVI